MRRVPAVSTQAVDDAASPAMPTKEGMELLLMSYQRRAKDMAQ